MRTFIVVYTLYLSGFTSCEFRVEAHSEAEAAVEFRRLFHADIVDIKEAQS